MSPAESETTQNPWGKRKMRDTTRNYLTIVGGLILLLGFGINNNFTIRGYEDKIQGLQTDLGQTKTDLAAVQEERATENKVVAVVVEAILAADPKDVERVFGNEVYADVALNYLPEGKRLPDLPIVVIETDQDTGTGYWFSIENDQLVFTEAPVFEGPAD
ncbi:MAG: hypothetical protein V1716_02515 [Candidatus Uhrbacteria bacterium]